MIAISSGRAIFDAGMMGAGRIEVVARRWMRNVDSPLPEANAQAGFIVQSFAVVWAAISFNVPVEIGQPMMKEQIDLLYESLPEFGLDWSREQTEAAVGRAWMRLIQVQGEGGDKLFRMSSQLLEHYLGVDHNELAGTLEMSLAVSDIMSLVKSALNEDHRSHGEDSSVHGVVPARDEISVEPAIGERYPLEMEEIDELEPDDVARHVANLEKYQPPKTLAELRRRKSLRAELKRSAAPLPAPTCESVPTCVAAAPADPRSKVSACAAKGLSAILKSIGAAATMGFVGIAMLSTISMYAVIAAVSFLVPLAIIVLIVRSC